MKVFKHIIFISMIMIARLDNFNYPTFKYNCTSIWQAVISDECTQMNAIITDGSEYCCYLYYEYNNAITHNCQYLTGNNYTNISSFISLSWPAYKYYNNFSLICESNNNKFCLVIAITLILLII